MTLEPSHIELRGVAKSYRSGRALGQVVEDCSFTIEPGKLTVMIGPSGAGKSTLVRLIAGFERPERGEILAGGKPVRGPGRDRQVMFQECALFPWMTTAGNVVYGPKARGELTSETKDVCEELIESTGLSEFRSKYPAHLSGGMQRRAELVRAMVNEPALMILDEPFRGLDALTKKLMLELYAELCERSPRTTLFVTTDVEEALFLADRVLVMSHIPTRVVDTVDVDLPRPRQFAGLLADDRANDLKIRLLSLLHQEAMRSFGTGHPSRHSRSA